MIKPVTDNQYRSNRIKERIKKDAAFSLAVGTVFGTWQTVGQLKQTSKATNTSIKEISRMFSNKLKFVTSTSLFKNIAVQSLQMAGIIALTSFVMSLFNNKNK